MPTFCPVCKLAVPGEHRLCVLGLFQENKIQSVEDWERRCLKRIRVREPRETPKPTIEVSPHQSESTPGTTPA
jgi:hypothetical protein